MEGRKIKVPLLIQILSVVDPAHARGILKDKGFSDEEIELILEELKPP